MSNDYYEVTTDLTPFTKARSNVIDTELAGIEGGFDLLPSLAQTRSANTSFVAAGGTANAITLNHPLVAWSTYTGKDGHKINVQITTTNTGAVTLAVDGLSAKACKRNDGTALQSGDLVAGGFYDFIYDETAGYFVVPEAINGVLDDCEDQVAIAVASTNFKGLWSDQSGAASIPYSVYHNGGFYALVSNLADVTAKTPGADPEWVLIDSGISYSGMRGAVTAPAFAFHNGNLWLLITSSADITADVPGSSAKWTKIDGNTTASSALGSGWNIDCASGYADFTKTVASTDAFTISNVPAAGVYTFVLEIEYTSGTITFFSGYTVNWPATTGGLAPTFSAGHKYKIPMEIRGGTTVIDVLSVADYA
jgi:hypothetical protein